MFKQYVSVNGKKYRKGFTTGSCAAAASKAAALLALGHAVPGSVEIDTPSGIVLNLNIFDVQTGVNWGKCAVKKDSGDDPDVTNGIFIYSRVELVKNENIFITGGEGVGIVTQPGLKIPVGYSAINPVPLQMIESEVKKVLPQGTGANITIEVPEGKEIAKRTYNPRLGIKDGISILGTSGIVNPMSDEAWKESLALELEILKAKGYKEIIYTFGNIGENFAVNNLNLPKERIVITSNFLGFMLDKAVEAGFEKVLLVGQLGKLVKVAGGIFHTHSRVADARIEILGYLAALCGADSNVINELSECVTTDAASEVLTKNGLDKVFELICERASQRCAEHSFKKLQAGTVLFKGIESLLFIDRQAEQIIDVIKRCK